MGDYRMADFLPPIIMGINWEKLIPKDKPEKVRLRSNVRKETSFSGVNTKRSIWRTAWDRKRPLWSLSVDLSLQQRNRRRGCSRDQPTKEECIPTNPPPRNKSRGVKSEANGDGGTSGPLNRFALDLHQRFGNIPPPSKGRVLRWRSHVSKVFRFIL